MTNLSAIAASSWIDTCGSTVLAQNLTDVFVDINGAPTNGYFAGKTAGITIDACFQFCGPDTIYQAFNYTSFSSSFTSWLLPWLALTAQLPYEASGSGSNIMSALMAIGSPALITYSLSLTILNRLWIRKKFSLLKKTAHDALDWAPHIVDRINASGKLLQDAQQAPIRVSQEHGWLSSLIVLPDNKTFWEAVKKDLRNTRRGYTASLFAQMLMVAVSYLLTVIAALVSSLGVQPVAMQIAWGSIWIWMIPVILGWIIVGTQSRSGAIDDALQSGGRKSYRALPERNGDDGLVVEDRQKGIVVRTSLNPIVTRDNLVPPSITPVPSDRPNGDGESYIPPSTPNVIELRPVPGPSRLPDPSITPVPSDRPDGDGKSIIIPSTQNGIELRPVLGPSQPSTSSVETHVPSVSVAETHKNDPIKIPRWFGCDVIGDEKEEGPIYNYSRVLTWFQCARTVEKSYECMLQNLCENRLYRKQVDTEPWRKDVAEPDGRNPLVGTSAQVAAYCGLANSNIDAYIPWSAIPAGRIMFAMVVAIFVQWGTTGPAILIAYYSPEMGLGCRSGSYVLYGSASIAAWLLLMGSSFLSHAVMRRHQDSYKRNPHIDISKQRRRVGHSILCGLAVITRFSGKIIAVLNAVFLVVASLLEYIGTFKTCWCQGNFLNYRHHGWVAVYMTTDELRHIALGSWAGGFAFSLSVCLITLLFIWCATSDYASK